MTDDNDDKTLPDVDELVRVGQAQLEACHARGADMQPILLLDTKIKGANGRPRNVLVPVGLGGLPDMTYLGQACLMLREQIEGEPVAAAFTSDTYYEKVEQPEGLSEDEKRSFADDVRASMTRGSLAKRFHAKDPKVTEALQLYIVTPETATSVTVPYVRGEVITWGEPVRFEEGNERFEGNVPDGLRQLWAS